MSVSSYPALLLSMCRYFGLIRYALSVGFTAQDTGFTHRLFQEPANVLRCAASLEAASLSFAADVFSIVSALKLVKCFFTPDQIKFNAAISFIYYHKTKYF